MSLQLGSWDIHKKIKCPGQIWVVWYKQVVYDLVVLSIISWGQQTMPAPPPQGDLPGYRTATRTKSCTPLQDYPTGGLNEIKIRTG